METYGEDPYLTGRMAVAFIRVLQGTDPHAPGADTAQWYDAAAVEQMNRPGYPRLLHAFALKSDVRPGPDERLAPGATADDVRAAVAGKGETVVVVGHQPDCGRITATLTGGPEPPFAPAGMVVLELL